MNTDAYIDYSACQAALDALPHATSTAGLCPALGQLARSLGYTAFLMVHLEGAGQEIAEVAHDLQDVGGLHECLRSAALERMVNTRIPLSLDGQIPLPAFRFSFGVSMVAGLTTCILILGREAPLEAATMSERAGVACLAATNCLSVLVMSARTSCPLTARELECLVYAAAGGTAKTIGRHLGISPRTVEEYLDRSKNRLGTRNALTASAQCLRRGWISSTDIDSASALLSRQSEESRTHRRGKTT